MIEHEFFGSYWWLFPFVMIFFCYLFMRGCSTRRMCGLFPQNGTEESALEILNKRFAKGEIDQKEYEEKKGVLQNQKTQVPHG